MAEMKSKRIKINAAVWFLLPYILLFVTFIVIPVIAAIVLSFTNYDSIRTPVFSGFLNYINLLTQDEIFMQYVLPNTCVFAFVVGPIGYICSFLLAWMLAQISKGPRTVLALLIYSPSLTSGVAIAVVWKIIFAGEQEHDAKNINASLINANNVFVESRNKPLFDVPEIAMGNQPIDDGNYLFTQEEMDAFIAKEPATAKYFKLWYGALEFINRKPRYCLWLGDCPPNELRKLPLAMKRVEAVRAFRLKSKRQSTLNLLTSQLDFSRRICRKEIIS